MKKKIFVGKLVDYERMNCSCYGNPKFYGVFENENGETLKATTATNAGCAYGFLNKIDELREVEYHTTRNGNHIIDYIRFK
jgi:hypothetical protein